MILMQTEKYENEYYNIIMMNIIDLNGLEQIIFPCLLSVLYCYNFRYSFYFDQVLLNKTFNNNNSDFIF